MSLCLMSNNVSNFFQKVCLTKPSKSHCKYLDFWPYANFVLLYYPARHPLVLCYTEGQKIYLQTDFGNVCLVQTSDWLRIFFFFIANFERIKITLFLFRKFDLVFVWWVVNNPKAWSKSNIVFLATHKNPGFCFNW